MRFSMYHFVKFNNTWYFKPESIQDIIDHFNKICGREFKEGAEDFINNTIILKDGEIFSRNHTSSVWRTAVELEMGFKETSWLKAATSLEEKTFKDRIEMFTKGRFIYFTDGLPYFCSNDAPEYDDEKYTEELIYPYDYNYEDCRFLQWPNGHHWYVKIGKIDICDKYGNYKFSDKSYAQKVAKDWCKCSGDWTKIKNI